MSCGPYSTRLTLTRTGIQFTSKFDIHASILCTYSKHELEHLDNRRLDPHEAAEAITRLGMYTTKEAFEALFTRLDADGSGDLEWEVRSLSPVMLLTLKVSGRINLLVQPDPPETRRYFYLTQ